MEDPVGTPRPRVVPEPRDDTPLPAFQRPVRYGGLMRCCLGTLEQSRRQTVIGSEAECPVCSAIMVVDPSGAWAWVAPATVENLKQRALARQRARGEVS